MIQKTYTIICMNEKYLTTSVKSTATLVTSNFLLQIKHGYILPENGMFPVFFSHMRFVII